MCFAKVLRMGIPVAKCLSMGFKPMPFGGSDTYAIAAPPSYAFGYKAIAPKYFEIILVKILFFAVFAL